MIVTLGETMFVLNGPPDAPLDIHQAHFSSFAGAESNVAIGLARMGHAVKYLSIVGDDPFGRAIVRQLHSEGVDVSGVRVSKEHPTGLMVKERRPGEEPSVYYYRNTSAFSRASAGTFDPEDWRGAKVIYLSGITPALSDGCRELFVRVIEDAAEHGIPVWLDPNYRSKLWTGERFREVLSPLLGKVNTILPGLAEGQLLTGKQTPGEVACMLMGMGVKNVIVKAGEEGAFAYTARGHASARQENLARVVDPIGAGDAFAAGYLAAELEGLSVEECLKKAHAVAARVCLTVGDWEGIK